MADSNKNDLDIYITNKSSNIENELVIYLKEKKVIKKVIKFYLNSIK
jgi:hypothetical protein